MKTLIIFITSILLFTGCFNSKQIVAENKSKIEHFSKAGKLLCSHSDYIPGMRNSSLNRKEFIVMDNNSSILINKNNDIILKDLSVKKYELEFCSIINESDTFNMDDGEYILINGVVRKLKS
jgi:hypothetical protein